MNLKLDRLAGLAQHNFASQKSLGEVFTPQELVGEMLDTLPQEVWSNPDFKWLDPAAGVGNFFALVYPRLMEGLKPVIKTEKKRSKHILENMLYFVEIQDKHVAAINEIFRGDIYKLNIYSGDFSNFSAHAFGVREYDVVLGNPPYQMMNSEFHRKAKNHNLWTLFVRKGFSMVAAGGYLLYVTPPAWMSPASKLLQEIFLRYQLVFVNINECSRHFKGIGSLFSYYLIHKVPVYKETHFKFDFKGGSNIRSQKGVSSYYLNSRIKFIPQLPTAETFSILEKTVFSDLPKMEINYDSDLHRFTKKNLLSSYRDKSFRFKIIHTPSQVVWSSRPHKNQGVPKVLIPLTTYYERIMVDSAGNTQGMGYMLCETSGQAETYKTIFLNPLYRYIANVTRWSNFNVPQVMKSLPKYPLDRDHIDESIFEYFQLAPSEIRAIQASVKDLSMNRGRVSSIQS